MLCRVFSHGGSAPRPVGRLLLRVCSEGLFTLMEAVFPLFYARVISEPRFSLGLNNLYRDSIQGLWAVWMS